MVQNLVCCTLVRIKEASNVYHLLHFPTVRLVIVKLRVLCKRFKTFSSVQTFICESKNNNQEE